MFLMFHSFSWKKTRQKEKDIVNLLERIEYLDAI